MGHQSPIDLFNVGLLQIYIHRETQDQQCGVIFLAYSLAQKLGIRVKPAEYRVLVGYSVPPYKLPNA